MRHLWVELAGEAPGSAPDRAPFARRLRALGAGVGVGVWRLSRASIDAAGGPVDFVSIDARGDLSTLAGLALGSVVAPVVIAQGVSDAGRARWLAGHGATALSGDGLAAPIAMSDLVHWMTGRSRALDL